METSFVLESHFLLSPILINTELTNAARLSLHQKQTWVHWHGVYTTERGQKASQVAEQFYHCSFDHSSYPTPQRPISKVSFCMTVCQSILEHGKAFPQAAFFKY